MEIVVTVISVTVMVISLYGLAHSYGNLSYIKVNKFYRSYGNLSYS